MNSRLDVEAGKIAAMVSAGYIEPDGNNGWTSTYSTNQLERAMTEVSDRYNIDANTIAAMQTGIDNNGQSLTLYSRWMTNLGVENLLRATDLCEELNTSANAVWSLADDKHGWYDNTGNGNTVTRIDLSSTDRPFNNVTRAWRMSVASSATLTSHTLTQYDVPVVYQKEYTISVYARCTSGSASIRLQASRPGESHVGAFDISAADNSSWTLFKYTFTHDFEDSKNYVNIDIGLRNNYGACVVEFCAIKLELGGIPTTWCPSVFDVEAQTQAFIEVESNRITHQVSDLSGNISRIEETATGIQMTVANMQVGGTNLCLDSKKDANQSHNTYNLQDFNLEESLIAGKTYTVSAKITLSSERQQVGFFHSGSTYAMIDVDDNKTWVAKTAGTAIYKRTFVATSNMESQTGGAGHGFVRVYSSTTTGGASQGSTPISGTGHVDWIKLEEGNMASGWSPAPGDMQEAMDGNDVITLINLSSTTATIQAKHIDLNGAVTFSSLATDAQNKINTAQSTADTAKSNAATAQSTANSALTKANAADTTLTNWCYNNNKTYIDGSNLYTGTVNASALNLYGELTIKKSKTGTTGGYMGYETGNNGVDDTNGMIIRDSSGTKSYDYYALKDTYKSYIHLSDSGIILRSPYIQLRQSGTQAVKIINDNGLNLKEYNSAGASHGKLAITAQSYASDSNRANLHINAAALTLNFSDGCWFEPLTSGNDFFLQPGNTKGQIGSYTENSSGSYTKDRWWSIIWCKSTRFSSIYSEDTTVHALSDRRQKHDIVYEVPDDVIDKLKPAHFILNNDDEQKVQYGFIAQDVQEVFPGAVGELEMGSNKWLTLSYTYFIPLLVDKCQRLQKQIDNLEEALISK